MTKLIPLCVLLFSSAGAAFAEPFDAPKKAPEPPVVEVHDTDLEKDRAMMDARYAQRAAEVKKAANEQAEFFIAMSGKRLAYDRHALEERKAFYLYLKSVSMDERHKATKEFNAKQKANRRKFDKDILSEEAHWFKKNIDRRWESESLMSEQVSTAPQRAAVTDNEPYPENVAPAMKKASRAAAKRKSSKRSRSSAR